MFEKNHSISVYCSPIALKQNVDKLFVSNFLSFIAGVVASGDQPLHMDISANFRINSKWLQEFPQGIGEIWFLKKT
jgi:hypothetical protein